MSTSLSQSKKRKMFRETQSEKIVYRYDIDTSDLDSEPSQTAGQCMEDSIAAVENILMYTFNRKSLLEDALTHSSYTSSPSYERLEFLGDAVIGLAMSKFFYLEYPQLEPGQLSLLRAANISTEKLARVAVRCGLYKFVRHRTTTLSKKVKEFVDAVEEEDEMVVHGGQLKAPKVLADIVESVAAAVFDDLGMDLRRFWMVMRKLFEPIVMLKVLEKQPQPVTELFEACQKKGQNVDIKHWRKGAKNIASVYVDGRFVTSVASENKENAKLNAAKVALPKLTEATTLQIKADSGEVNNEIEGAKQKLHQLCNKKRWQKPSYRVDQQFGPAHDRKYVCCVQIELSDTTIVMKGDERSRVKDAETSAASAMFCALRESGYI